MEFFFLCLKRIYSKFFFFVVRCPVLLEGTMNPVLQLGGVLPNNIYVDCTLFEKFFLGLFSNIFFSRNFVSAILEVCLELEFFSYFFATFVAVLFNLTKARFVS